MIAAARKRSVRSSRSSVVRTNRSWASVCGWNASATSAGTRLVGPAVASPEPAAERRSLAGSAMTRAARASQAAASAFQARRSCGEPRRGRGARRRVDLGRGQQVGERVEVVADADPALGARLERRGAAAGERVEDDVAGPRVAGDERVGRGPPGSSRGTSTSGGRSGPTGAAGPSTRVRGRSRAARAGARGRAGPRRARAMALGSVRPTSASRNLPDPPRRSPVGAMGRGA